MAFDPVTLLTMSVVALVALGAVMLRSAAGEGAGGALRPSGAAFLCLGAGFALLLAAPADVHAPARVLADALLILPYGLLWRAARDFDGRPAPFEAVVAGALLWLLTAAFLDLSQAWRIALTSAVVAVYSFATALEHRRGGALAPRRWAARAFAGHGAVFALRALLGLAAWGPGGAGGWGALLGVEAVPVAVLVGLASLAMDRERAAARHRRDALEDPLTGVGNRRALHGSGAGLIAAARGAGRPAALLMMGLDGLEAVGDRHGPPAGDQLLVAFARLAHDYLPPTSLVCRVGGGEFAAVLPGADLGRARAVADEMRLLFRHVAIEGRDGPVRATASVGVAVLGEGDDLGTLLGRADACLREAERAGRDRVVAESAGGPRGAGRTAA